MNANELADELEKCCLVSWGECTHEDYDTDIWTKMKSATMLRQQQAEIEALKAGKIRAYDNGVEDGRKPNTNPVKDLTDEEIEIEWFKVFKPETGIGKNLTNGVYEFALAILRKAQE